MSRSVLYTNNDTIQNVQNGGTIGLGNVIRRYGCNCQLSGNVITIDGAGYYDISATVVVTPEAAGTVTVTGYQDSVALPGVWASTTVAATDTIVTLPLIGVARNTCGQPISNLKFVLSGVDATVSNIAVKVRKT